ncbi:MAG: hypothetical protein IJS08_09015 [Victivallales bacterium]|nr:hypothetical protein [Victivallales bacterium]
MDGNLFFKLWRVFDWLMRDGTYLPEKHQWWSIFIAILLTCYSLGSWLIIGIDGKKPKFCFHKLSFWIWDTQIPLGKDNAPFPLAIVWFLPPFIPFVFFLCIVRWLFYFYFKMTG